MKESLRILREEHRSISAVLMGLKHLARLAEDAAVKPDFRPFRAMIRYIDEYPERLHHPKEDELLFARLGKRCPEAAAVIQELRREHEEGARRVRDLERALLFYEDAWPEGRSRFSELIDTYADFHWAHMRKEEEEVMPLAERTLAPEDWKVIDAGFAEHADPLAQVAEKDFETLFTRIVNLAPSPVGLGDPWKRA